MGGQSSRPVTPGSGQLVYSEARVQEVVRISGLKEYVVSRGIAAGQATSGSGSGSGKERKKKERKKYIFSICIRTRRGI